MTHGGARDEDRTDSVEQGSGEVAHDREVEREEDRVAEQDGLPAEAGDDFTFPNEDAQDE